MKKFLTGIVALVATIGALGGYSAHADSVKNTATETSATGSNDNITFWVNDESLSYGEGGFYLDPASCQIWTPDRSWHYRAPTSPIWVNAPYGTAASGGGLYWDSVSCQVWTADSGWHVFNVLGIWPDSAPNPADFCARHLAPGEVAYVRGGCIVTGDILVSARENGPWEDLSYDTDPNTGTLVLVQSPLWVHAPFGASVWRADQLTEAINALLDTGCEAGCSWVNIARR